MLRLFTARYRVVLDKFVLMVKVLLTIVLIILIKFVYSKTISLTVKKLNFFKCIFEFQSANKNYKMNTYNKHRREQRFYFQ